MNTNEDINVASMNIWQQVLSIQIEPYRRLV